MSSACRQDPGEADEPNKPPVVSAPSRQGSPGPQLSVTADTPLKIDAVHVSPQIKESIPEAPLEWAKEIVCQLGENYRKAGQQNPQKSFTVAKAEIAGLAPLETGSAALNHDIVMYRLKWRLYADHPENMIMQSGLIIENGALTEKSCEGDTFLILVRFCGDTPEDVWERINILTSEQIKAKYSLPVLLEKYGSPYTAACMEEFSAWKAQGGEIPVKGARSER
ncbi:hypothetical protein IJT93_01160 [bacterium]|nr:hypothetical protein [bacterium]